MSSNNFSAEGQVFRFLALLAGRMFNLLSVHGVLPRGRMGCCFGRRTLVFLPAQCELVTKSSTKQKESYAR